MHRPVGTRNVSKAAALPSLLDLPVSSKSRGGGSGLLGNMLKTFFWIVLK